MALCANVAVGVAVFENVSVDFLHFLLLLQPVSLIMLCVKFLDCLALLFHPGVIFQIVPLVAGSLCCFVDPV